MSLPEFFQKLYLYVVLHCSHVCFTHAFKWSVLSWMLLAKFWGREAASSLSNVTSVRICLSKSREETEACQYEILRLVGASETVSKNWTRSELKHSLFLIKRCSKLQYYFISKRLCVLRSPEWQSWLSWYLASVRNVTGPNSWEVKEILLQQRVSVCAEIVIT